MKALSLLRYHVSVNGKRLVREVVEHPGAVAIVPVNEKGEIILVKQYRLPAGKHLMEIPAGKKRDSENNEECARRELLEEMGYKARILKRVGSFYLALGYSTEMIALFIARGLEMIKQSLDEDEAIEVLENVKSGIIEDAKTIIGIYEPMNEVKDVSEVNI